MDYTEISVDPKFHRHLIGKGGVNSKYSYYVVGTTLLNPSRNPTRPSGEEPTESIWPHSRGTNQICFLRHELLSAAAV